MSRPRTYTTQPKTAKAARYWGYAAKRFPPIRRMTVWDHLVEFWYGVKYERFVEFRRETLDLLVKTEVQPLHKETTK